MNTSLFALQLNTTRPIFNATTHIQPVCSSKAASTSAVTKTATAYRTAATTATTAPYSTSAQAQAAKMTTLLTNLISKHPTAIGLAGGIVTPLIVARCLVNSKLYTKQNEEQMKLEILIKNADGMKSRLTKLDEYVNLKVVGDENGDVGDDPGVMDMQYNEVVFNF
ncbi:unnamed protein product [Ambrosiozyma monospora]|uniref:Unnamed protein product n=1 Tax=Ambrosiozyma monospora TaxID=43982 RepID=A0ACB5ST34_AMBMO|nr:unnamed protein product [Ambrosiozyma monospora]